MSGVIELIFLGALAIGAALTMLAVLILSTVVAIARVLAWPVVVVVAFWALCMLASGVNPLALVVGP